MIVDRRALIAGGLSVVALGTATRTLAASAAARLESEIALFAAGAPVEPLAFGLTIDPFVESGYTVPVRVDAARHLIGDRISALRLLAPHNPLLRVASFTFGPSATGTVATRIRLARSQDVIALARTAGGRVLRQDVHVEVVVGGCGFDVEESAG